MTSKLIRTRVELCERERVLAVSHGQGMRRSLDLLLKKLLNELLPREGHPRPVEVDYYSPVLRVGHHGERVGARPGSLLERADQRFQRDLHAIYDELGIGRSICVSGEYETRTQVVHRERDGIARSVLMIDELDPRHSR